MEKSLTLPWNDDNDDSTKLVTTIFIIHRTTSGEFLIQFCKDDDDNDEVLELFHIVRRERRVKSPRAKAAELCVRQWKHKKRLMIKLNLLELRVARLEWTTAREERVEKTTNDN